MVLTDSMQIPVGAPHPRAAQKMIDFVYQPEVQAKITAYVNYVPPVKGAKEILEREEPEIAENPLIFPDLSKAHNFKTFPPEPGARDRLRVPAGDRRLSLGLPADPARAAPMGVARIATTLGTMMALALVRYQFRGRGPVNFFIFLPLASPEVVLGAALLSLFITATIATGFTTILIAHVMFNISFVVVTVRSRLIGFDRHLEEAAQGFGANGLQTFMRVTLPLIAPGVLAGALLAFALSIDDFVITVFNSGSTVTFPLYIFGVAQRGIPPQVNVLATISFLVTLALMVATVWQQRRAERIAAVRPDAAG